MKQPVKIKFQNGLSYEHFVKDVFEVNKVTDDFIFEESETPDFIVFGPYGDDLPAKGAYTRIGYFCENIMPDMNICEWAFGVPNEEKIKDIRYKRIQWHGVDPTTLIKDISDNDIDRIFQEKSKFCNFIYSNPIPYREEFFKQLSKYKKIDAPGRSMNNMASIDSLFSGDMFERKRQFLTQYKFTIAFENYAYPGYQTEKLYDAMLVNSLPIYCGDKNIDNTFNSSSFLNIADHVNLKDNLWIDILEDWSQLDFNDYRPKFHKGLISKAKRKFKSFGRLAKMKSQFNGLDFSPLIDRIIEIDKDEALYKKYLKEPWFHNNKIPVNSLSHLRWKTILS